MPGARQVRWAKVRRAEMIRVLGGKCVHCGTTQCLTFDCIRPTGDKHHRLSSVARVTYYAGQMRNGNLQLLCSDCNSHKGAVARPRYLATAGCVSFPTPLSDPQLR